ncbi:uncharacterized protein LOC128345978 [Hemicordylus capensis]|uniref:uncharacterized protein LOC128345978 n=1 Tax=Hemicordylus capensis TaxID=884348 RepID=UPI002304558D|nr:uncharacterized protein LOC128345978 [Hemicordylus capensis]
MKSLQVLLLCFLLLSTAFGGTYTDFASFTCNKTITAEIGQNVTITCMNNEEISDVTVNFCCNSTSCPNTISITKPENITTAENGRISLKRNITSVYLHINNVQITDHRNYGFILHAVNGHESKNISLVIHEQYTKPQITKQNDTFVCKTYGRDPKGQLYWFDTHGTNLTHNSVLDPSIAEGCSFSLSSTLLLKSDVNKELLCCTPNNTTCSVPFLVQLHNDTGEMTPEGLIAEKSTIIPIVMVTFFVLLIALLCWKMKKGPINVHWPKRLNAFHQPTLFKLVPNGREPIPQKAQCGNDRNAS